MKNIPREEIAEVLNNLSTESNPIVVEITTFNFDTIKGKITNFKLSEYNEAMVLVEDDEGIANEIEIDFIRDLIIYDK